MDSVILGYSQLFPGVNPAQSNMCGFEFEARLESAQEYPRLLACLR